MLKFFQKTLSGILTSILVIAPVLAAAPTQNSIFKNGTEDITLSLTLADFTAGFSDTDGDSLQKIQYNSSPEPNAILELSGVPVTIGQEISAAQIPNLTLVPTANYNGIAIFGFTASDGTTYSNPQSDFFVTFAAVNDLPIVATPIPDQNATQDVPFSYSCPNNTFSDVDTTDTLTLSATLTNGAALPAWVTFTPATCTFAGTPANGDVDVVPVRVTANDGNGGTVTDDFNITVANVNDAPTVANAIPDQNATEDVAFSYSCPNNTFNDIDGNTLTLAATKTDGTALPAWVVFTPATCTFAGTPANGDVGVVPVRVTANDGNGGNVTDDFNITVANVNDIPVYNGTLVNQNGTVGTAVTPYQFAINVFTDAEGDTLTYSASNVPAGLTFTPATRTFAGTPTTAGTVTVTVTANDGNGGTVNGTFNYVIVNAVVGNNAPVVANPIPDQSATEDVAFSYSCPNNTFNDADGDTLTLSATLTSGAALPAWVTFTPATCTFAGTPANGDVGVVPVRVTANDGNGGTVTDDFNITVANVNDAPVYNGTLVNQNGVVGTPVTDYTFATNVFTDAEGDTLTYSATNVPAGLTFTPATRTFAGTPTTAGTVTVTVTANDGNGGTVSGTFNYVITATANNAPTVANPIPDQNATEDLPFTYSCPNNTFNDVNGDTLTLSATLTSGAALPAWVIFTPATCTFAGTPANGDVGIVPIRITANDGNGGTVNDFFNITVANVNDAPVYNGGLTDQTGTVGTAVTPYQFAANVFTDVDGNTLSYSASNVPSGLSFDGLNRTFSGTPTTSGTILVTVTANDGNGGSVNGTFNYVISPAAVISSGGGGGGGGSSGPDYTTPYKLVCPSNINRDQTLYNPLSLEKTDGIICQNIHHTNPYQKHDIFYPKGTKVIHCSTQQAFQDILYTTKTIALSKSPVPAPSGETLIRVVDVTTNSDDACFSATTPEMSMNHYTTFDVNAYDVLVYRVDKDTKALTPVTVTQADNTIVKFPILSTGTYIATVRTKGIKATTPTQKCFVDMENHPAKEAVEELLAQGVLTCKETFNPNFGATRAEMTKFALEAFKRMSVPTSNYSYPDVPTDAWFHDYVIKGTELGVVHGYPDSGLFKPSQIVKRGEALKMLLLASNLESINGNNTFRDISDNDWYYYFAQFSQVPEIFSINSDGTFNAGENVNRAEVALMLVEAQKMLMRNTESKVAQTSVTPLTTIVPVNTQGYFVIQIQDKNGRSVQEEGVPVWCQVRMENTPWYFFDTVKFTNKDGKAVCRATFTQAGTGEFRGLQDSLTDSDMGTTQITWK